MTPFGVTYDERSSIILALYGSILFTEWRLRVESQFLNLFTYNYEIPSKIFHQ